MFYHHQTCEGGVGEDGGGVSYRSAPFVPLGVSPLLRVGRHDLSSRWRSDGSGCCSRFGGSFYVTSMWCSNPHRPAAGALHWVPDGSPGLSVAPEPATWPPLCYSNGGLRERTQTSLFSFSQRDTFLGFFSLDAFTSLHTPLFFYLLESYEWSPYLLSKFSITIIFLFI